MKNETEQALKAVVNKIRRLRIRAMNRDGSEIDFNLGLNAVRIEVESMLASPRVLADAIAQAEEEARIEASFGPKL